MSYIDNIRMKALNAGSGNVSITGNDLLSLINEIQAGSGNGTVTSVSGTSPLSGTVTTSGSLTTSMATNKLIGRGTAGTGVMEEITLGTGLSLAGTTLNAATGLATNGSTTGGTAFNQEFSKGVTVGAANTEDGVLNFFNNADATQVVVTSPTTKQLTVGNTGNDVEVGINCPSEASVALNVYGNVKAQTVLLLGTGSVNLSESNLNEMLLTASAGVSTSAGLTVGTTFTVGTTQYVTEKINIGSGSVLGCNTTPVQLLGNSPAGTVYNIIDAFAILTYNSVTYSTLTKLYLVADPTEGETAAQMYLEGGFINETVSAYGKFQKMNYTGGKNQLVPESKLYLLGNSDAASGDGTLDIYITYAIVTV